MSKEQVKLDQYDAWLKDDSDVAALVMRQWLVPVEGRDAVVFPPTYAIPERPPEDWVGYNIDTLKDGTKVCQIDSVGSQANRMEPIFMREPYSSLVPQVIIKAGDREVNLLEAGHRAADAMVRFSDLASRLEPAFRKWQEDGNAVPLAKIAPTSLVFGAWDSRATQAKLPRIVRSVIRAYDVDALHRSAQYTTIAGEILEGADVEVATKGPKAKLGLAHVPAAWTHGGILVRGEIRRDAALNLVAIRALGADPQDPDGALRLRRYVLGLSLLSFTAPQETFLREGCQLVPDTERPGESNLVRHDGVRAPLTVSHEQALGYAQDAAKAFGVGKDIQADFDPKKAKEALGQTKQERKASRARRAESEGDQT
jgi:CRISPR-associated protein Csb1